MDHATQTDWSYRAILAGGVATNNREDGELGTSSTAWTTTKEPATKDPAAADGDNKADSDVGDGAAPGTTASAESSTVASGRPEGPPINDLVVPGDVLNSLQGDTARNTSDGRDLEASVKLRQDKDDVHVAENEDEPIEDEPTDDSPTALGERIHDEPTDEELMSFLNDVLTSPVDDANDVIDDAVLPGDDNSNDVHNDNENKPENTEPLPSTQTLAADHSVDIKSSVINPDRVPSTEIPTDVHSESEDDYSSGDDKPLRELRWQGGYDGSATATLLQALNSDTASKLFEQVVNNNPGVSDMNNDNSKIHVKTQVELLQQDSNRTKLTADSTERETSTDLTASREVGKRTTGPEVAIIASPTGYPYPDNEKTSRLEPASLSGIFIFEDIDRNRYNAWSSKTATTTVKPKPDVVTGNGNSVPVCYRGR